MNIIGCIILHAVILNNTIFFSAGVGEEEHHLEPECLSSFSNASF